MARNGTCETPTSRTSRHFIDVVAGGRLVDHPPLFLGAFAAQLLLAPNTRGLPGDVHLASSSQRRSVCT